jgi:hypothetical protein
MDLFCPPILHSLAVCLNHSPIFVPPVGAARSVSNSSLSATGVAHPPPIEISSSSQPVAELLVAGADVESSASGYDAGSVAELPVAEFPVVEFPVAELPVAELPVAELSVAEFPVVEFPVAELPVAEFPVAELSVADPLVGELSVAELPVAEFLPRCGILSRSTCSDRVWTDPLVFISVLEKCFCAKSSPIIISRSLTNCP